MATVNRSFRAPAPVVCETLENRTLLSVAALDPNFGTGGKVSTGLSANYLGNNPVVDPYGRILVIDANAILRYRANGSLDTSFGAAGKLVLNAVKAGDDAPNIAGLALQSDGKIVVSWNEFPSQPDFQSQARPKLITFSEPYVARLNSNGKFDTTFGTNGISHVGELIGPLEQNTPLESAGINVLSSGKIVIGGDVGFDSTAFQAVRLNSNGKLDTTFGSGGLASKTLTDSDLATSFEVQTDGKLLVVGENGSLVRFTAAGQPDSTFGSGGKVAGNLQSVNGFLRGAALQPNNQLIVVGEIEVGVQNGPFIGEFYVERFKTNGMLDTTFAGGHVKTAFGAGTTSEAFAVAVQSNGQIVVTGSEGNSAGTTSNFALARYQTNGSLDTGFGTGGLATTSFGSNVFSQSSGIAIQSSGRLVVEGSYGAYPNSKLAIVRYLGNHAVIAAGQSQVTTGASLVADPRLAGSTIANKTLNFSDGSGASAVHGQLQEWIVKETVGATLDFYYRIVTASGSVAGISSLIASNFAGHTTYIDYRPDSTGTIAPVTASRSGDSKSVTFTFLANPPGNGLVTAGKSSYALLIKTDATTYNSLGKVLLNNVISIGQAYEPT